MPALSSIQDPVVRDWVTGEVITDKKLEADYSAMRGGVVKTIDYLEELQTNFSSGSEPTDLKNGFLWHDLSNNLLELRRSAAWEPVMTSGTGKEIDFATGGTGTIKPMGVINVNTTAVSAVGGDDVLMVYTIPANTLDANGKILRVKSWGIKIGGGGDYSMQMRLGGTVLHTVTWSLSGSWGIEMFIVQTGTSTQDWVFKGNTHLDSLNETELANTGTATEDETTDLIIDINAAIVNGADTVTQEGMIVEFLN